MLNYARNKVQKRIQNPESVSELLTQVEVVVLEQELMNQNWLLAILNFEQNFSESIHEFSIFSTLHFLNKLQTEIFAFKHILPAMTKIITASDLS